MNYKLADGYWLIADSQKRKLKTKIYKLQAISNKLCVLRLFRQREEAG